VRDGFSNWSAPPQKTLKPKGRGRKERVEGVGQKKSENIILAGKTEDKRGKWKAAT